MRLKLITLAGKKIDEEIYEAIIPTTEGEIAVFPGHEPLVVLTVPGVITVRFDKSHDDSKLELFAISGGVAEISQTIIRVLVDEADHGDDIIEAHSQAALERAMKMRDEAEDQIEIEKAQQLIDRHAVRLKVAELHRRKRL